MSTEQIILIALAVNFIVAVAVVIVPRIRQRRAEAAANHAAALRVAAGAPSGNSAGNPAAAPPPSGVASDAGEPRFPPTNAFRSAEAPAPRGSIATDGETGLDLAPAWARWLGEEDARIRRFHRPATIVLVDLTGLERLADRLGDEAAERLIPPIATTMRRQSRATDHLARLGPTTFGALLTETDEVRAINFVERVRSACDVWLEAGAVMLRLSMGWAEMSPERRAEVALPVAERRLYDERKRTWAMLFRQTDQGEVAEHSEAQLIHDLEVLRGGGRPKAGRTEGSASSPTGTARPDRDRRRP
jgi:diguanylate cyclase (GGDEF)-like protein